MKRRTTYLAAAALASAALGAWAFRDGAAPAAGEVRPAKARGEPAARPRVEVVRAPASRPANAPAAPAASQPTSRPALPPEYAILERRNLFARGGGGGPGARETAPAGAGGPEAAIILRGVAEAGDRLIAFVEDKAAGGVVQISEGDAVARGRALSITLDGFVYESGGASRPIRVGQNLAGQLAPPTPTSKPAAPPAAGPGGPQAPGGPHGPGRPGGPHRAPQPDAAPPAGVTVEQ